MMKTLKLLFMIGSLTCMLTACEDEQYLLSEDNVTELNLQSKISKAVELPFEARLHTNDAEDSNTELCEFISPTNFWNKVHQVGGGNATHLGRFTVDFKFCFHVVLDDQGNPDFEGGFGEYGGEGRGEPPVIIAANGDQLYTETTAPSRLIPIQDENYTFEFFNVFEIIGGTGRFENASGEYVHHGMIRNDGTGTDHDWEGSIILNK